MNVLVLNQQQNQLQSIEIDIIKSVTGQFEASEIIEMFKDFFYNKMILDVTALKGYDQPLTYKKLAEGLNPDKVIFYLPEGSDLCTSGFLSRLIESGIYNFTTNVDGVKYLVKRSNTYKDVESIVKMANSENHNNSPIINNIEQNNNSNSEVKKVEEIQRVPLDLTNKQIILGFQNVTSNAGSTSLIYMLKKELTATYGQKVVALEVDKNDFSYFNDKQMISTNTNDLNNVVNRLTSMSIILVDLNNTSAKDVCTSIIYIIEPSTIKLNNLVKKNKTILSFLKGKEVILNKSLLTSKEVGEFENESGLNILYNMPPLNDRKRNGAITDFLIKIRLISDNDSNKNSANKIFGLFRK